MQTSLRTLLGTDWHRLPGVRYPYITRTIYPY